MLKWFGLILLVLELLPYMVDGLAHYAEKVGDSQHYPWAVQLKTANNDEKRIIITIFKMFIIYDWECKLDKK